MSGARPSVTDSALWYHTMDLDGEVSPGWFDLRPMVDALPWPDVRGKRCLDVGTYDGFLAFELERRGATEVVATDIERHEDWDWAPRARALGPRHLAEMAGTKGRGFEIARDRLGSSVQRQWVNVYDLSPESVGTFDVVVCGCLLLHLRDPFRALDAIRSVCRDDLLSIEEIDPWLTLVSPRRPGLAVRGTRGQWSVPNSAAHPHMLHTAGFDVVDRTRPTVIPYGPAHPARDQPLRSRRTRALVDLVLGGRGLPVRAVRARPAR